MKRLISMALKIYAVILFPTGIGIFITASGAYYRYGLLARYNNFVPFYSWGLGLALIFTSVGLYRSRKWAVYSALIIGVIQLMLHIPTPTSIIFWGGLIVLSGYCIIKK